MRTLNYFNLLWRGYSNGIDNMELLNYAVLCCALRDSRHDKWMTVYIYMYWFSGQKVKCQQYFAMPILFLLTRYLDQEGIYIYISNISCFMYLLYHSISFSDDTVWQIVNLEKKLLRQYIHVWMESTWKKIIEENWCIFCSSVTLS